jgi:hypothetical protein
LRRQIAAIVGLQLFECPPYSLEAVILGLPEASTRPLSAYSASEVDVFEHGVGPQSAWLIVVALQSLVLALFQLAPQGEHEEPATAPPEWVVARTGGGRAVQPQTVAITRYHYRPNIATRWAQTIEAA